MFLPKFSFLVTTLKTITLSSDKLDIKMNIFKYFWRLLFSLSLMFNRFDARNAIIFQIKIFDRTLKELSQQGI